MSVYHFSKSRYCNGVQCPKMLWLCEHMPKEFDDSVMNETVLQTGSDVGDLAMGLFGDYTEVPFDKENLSSMIPKTNELLEAGTKVICEASFSYGECFCSVDILKNFGSRVVELYEVKSSTTVKENYKDDIAYQYYVLTKSGLTVRKACLVYINNEYVRHGSLELDKLFKIEDVTETVETKINEVETRIADLRTYLEQQDEPECAVGGQCSSPYACGYFNHCAFGEDEDGGYSVFDIASLRSSYKQDFYNQGLRTFDDLYSAGVLTGKYLQQVETEVKNLPPHISKDDIKKVYEVPIISLIFSGL